MIEGNGVELCTEPFGNPAHPPILHVPGQREMFDTFRSSKSGRRVRS